MQSPNPGLAVAERENERAQRARWLGAELWSERLLPTLKSCRGSSRLALTRGF